MYPQNLSVLQKERQEELVSAAEAWRRTHPCRHTLRYRTGFRLMTLGRRLMGGTGSFDG